MKIERDFDHPDGKNYVLIEDSRKTVPCYLARFSNVLEAGLALRYCQGLPMTENERRRAITALENAGQ